ncbi:MAG: type I phosphomannose isomerase catalytic subunit [Sphingomicrobium sp.]
MKLTTHHVEKPWGRTKLQPVFGNTQGNRIGEIWFECASGEQLPLLTKYIFTSEKLSIQVHPNDEQARERGLPSGKSECWYILDADPGATLGLGLTQSLSAAELRQAAIDGSIEKMIDWRPVAAGEFYFVAAGTIHAVGAGISLLEFQQNADVTYRLYDYGRPRELHLDDAIAVACRAAYPEGCARQAGGPIDTVLINGPIFSLVRASRDEAIAASLSARRRWVMPLEGCVTAGDERASAGECLMVEPGAPLDFAPGAVALVGAEGPI